MVTEPGPEPLARRQKAKATAAPAPAPTPPAAGSVDTPKPAGLLGSKPPATAPAAATPPKFAGGGIPGGSLFAKAGTAAGTGAASTGFGFGKPAAAGTAAAPVSVLGKAVNPLLGGGAQGATDGGFRGLT